MLKSCRTWGSIKGKRRDMPKEEGYFRKARGANVMQCLMRLFNSTTEKWDLAR